MSRAIKRMKQPICLFDSGIGGLTVLKKLISKFPQENYIYLADLARVPFGDKTKEEIKIIANEIIEWLSRFNPKLIIMACNTSSTVLCEQGRINPAPTVPLYGMIDCTAQFIANSHYDEVSVWATKLVVENNAYKKAINNINQNIKVQEITCPKLVPMIEDLSFNLEEKIKIISEYVEKTSTTSKALILGCTHYPLVQNDLKKLTDAEIIDPADCLINEMEKHLGNNLAGQTSIDNKTNISIYSTAQAEKVEKFSKLYLCGNYKTNLISLNKSRI